ncbi:hypothetical protein JHK87_045083 [Glycine soja]|nr:hypothetical protein JHK87_045083 [Glycine soja]
MRLAFLAWALMGRHEMALYANGRRLLVTSSSFRAPIYQSIKGGGHPHPSNIGDLFSEGSLNPYAEDPYAFD